MGCTCSRTAASGVQLPQGSGEQQKGEDIRDHYRIGALLGSGAFGQVRECRRRDDNSAYAVKIMEKRGKETGHWSNEAMFRREVELLGRMTHTNIVEYLDFYEDQHFLYAVMERCYGGELFDQIIGCTRFLENDASYLCRQMLNALSYCHELGIVHRDIKAENFLFKTDEMASDLKLIDFGMSAQLSSKNATFAEVCGSPHYLSPELIRKRYNRKADMWALGVLIYLMLFGRYPFDSRSTDAIVRQILSGKIDWSPGGVHVSEHALAFMRGLLERDPKKRFSAQEALEHVWIRNSETAEQWKRRKRAEQRLKKAAAGDLLSRVKRAQRRISRNRHGSSYRRESRRNMLLKRLERDWLHGKTTCIRVWPQGSQKLRPEYVRRDEVRHNTAPGRLPHSNLLDLQALRRHIESSYGRDLGADATAEVAAAPTEGGEQGDNCGLSHWRGGNGPPGVISPATTTASGDEASSGTYNSYLPPPGGHAKLVLCGYDWDAAEESLRREQKEDDAPSQPRRAVTVSVQQKEVCAAVAAAIAEEEAAAIV